MAEEPMAEEPISREREREALEAHMKRLITQADKHYSAKDYTTAADLYGYASSIQADLNGEIATQNAELLFLYGRSLYHVGINNSDVLGAKVGGAVEASEPSTNKGAASKAKATEPRGAKDGASTSKEASSGEAVTRPILGRGAAKPVLQFQGDENWDEPEDEEATDDEVDEEGGENAPGEDEDFTAAWENLDLARVFFRRQLDELQGGADKTKGKDKDVGDSAETKHIKERLADTHDLLAEIELEHEQFADAADDFKAVLALREALYPLESSMLAETHYKLSLALEFASLKSTAPEGDETGTTHNTDYDKAMRDEAAHHMDAAIRSAAARVKHEEQLLSLLPSQREAQGKGKVTAESVQDLKEAIVDMEQRAVELRKPPVSVESAAEAAAFADGSHPLAGLLGSLAGASNDERKAKIEEVMKGANDLSGLVKHKKAPAADTIKSEGGEGQGEPSLLHNPASNGADSSTGKRKAEVKEGPEDEVASPVKKVKLEEEAIGEDDLSVRTEAAGDDDEAKAPVSSS